MPRTLRQKLHSSRGMTRAVAVLLVLIVLCAVLLALPALKKFRFDSQRVACNAALATARDALKIDHIITGGQSGPDHARKELAQVMLGWQDLCPSGGTVYLIETESGAPQYTLVCGLHDTDTRYCTRLAADYVLTQLQNAAEAATQKGEEVPATIPISLNGKTYQAQEVAEPQELYHGTDYILKLKGTVIYYGLSGRFTGGEEATTAPNKICYFAFADEHYCARWQPIQGWAGDSWELPKQQPAA